MNPAATIVIIVTAGLLSCKERRTVPPKTTEQETVNSERKYEYADAEGNMLVIQNSLPRGGPHTDPEGKKYFKVIFWTQITNETDHTLDLKLNFPADSIEFPHLSGNYMKFLIPSDTMTLDKQSQLDYGVAIKPFLDTANNKSHSLERTIKPKEATAFFVILRSDRGAGGILRTGLRLKGQDLVYKISVYAMTAGLPLLEEKEIICGHINLRNLVPHR